MIKQCQVCFWAGEKALRRNITCKSFDVKWMRINIFYLQIKSISPQCYLITHITAKYQTVNKFFSCYKMLLCLGVLTWWQTCSCMVIFLRGPCPSTSTSPGFTSVFPLILSARSLFRPQRQAASTPQNNHNTTGNVRTDLRNKSLRRAHWVWNCICVVKIGHFQDILYVAVLC